MSDRLNVNFKANLPWSTFCACEMQQCSARIQHGAGKQLPNSPGASEKCESEQEPNLSVPNSSYV